MAVRVVYRQLYCYIHRVLHNMRTYQIEFLRITNNCNVFMIVKESGVLAVLMICGRREGVSPFTEVSWFAVMVSGTATSSFGLVDVSREDL